MPSLHWIGKDKVINHHLEVPYRLLKKGYSFGEDNSGNKIIRGDNLEALKALLPEYEGKIKCIYIDPPYNTGNEGWVYNDNVSDPKIKKWLGDVVGKEGEDLTRHDKWLCMMYPRLKLLHRLLTDDGAIFVSIDDNEQANLKLMLDEIFGSNNFVRNIIWHKRYAASNDSKGIPDMHDFIVCYQKTPSFQIKLLPRTGKQNDLYKYDSDDGRGLWRPDNLTVKTYSKSYDFPIINPNTGKEYHPTNGRSWMSNVDRITQWIQEGRIFFGKDGKGAPQLKRYLNEVQQGVVPISYWSYDEVNHTDGAKKELKEIFLGDKAPFQTPKPTQLMERIIHLSTNPGDIILDSFAGSGTTAHAVLNTNSSNSEEQKRKFILVEMEEYAESITAERVKRVIKGYGEKEGTGGGFDFYDLGPALLTSDGLLNENATVEEISAYICYTETALPLPTIKVVDHRYWLTRTEDRDHYFRYERESMTILDRGFLASITVKMPYYTIWADQCHLSESVMKKHGITFRKIPRDIRNI